MTENRTEKRNGKSDDKGAAAKRVLCPRLSESTEIKTKPQSNEKRTGKKVPKKKPTNLLVAPKLYLI